MGLTTCDGAKEAAMATVVNEMLRLYPADLGKVDPERLAK